MTGPLKDDETKRELKNKKQNKQKKTKKNQKKQQNKTAKKEKNPDSNSNVALWEFFAIPLIWLFYCYN